jgi:hypothetical protein
VGEAAAEVPLAGGFVARGVVRVGDTVRRPLTDDSERIHRLLAYFERRRFEGAPRFIGIGARGREILSFIEGFAPPHNRFSLTEEAAAAGARLVRRVHDLTADTDFAAGSEVAWHPNLSQQNWIFRDMIPGAIIDWDGSRPTMSSSPTWDQRIAGRRSAPGWLRPSGPVGRLTVCHR